MGQQVDLRQQALDFNDAERLARESRAQAAQGLAPGAAYELQRCRDNPYYFAKRWYQPVTPSRLERADVEALLDMSDPEVEQRYRSWDLGDCSLAGLAKILFYQTVRQQARQDPYPDWQSVLDAIDRVPTS